MQNEPFDPFRPSEASPSSVPPVSVPPQPQVQSIPPEVHHRQYPPKWIIIGIIVVIAICYGIYLLAHPSASTHTASVPATSTSSSSSTPASVPLQAGETLATNGSLSVPELSLTLVNLPSSLSDLRQFEDGFSAGETDINLSTTSLTALDADCADNSADNGGIGSLISTKGTYDASSDSLDPGASYIGQFSGFWLEFTPPQSACSNNNQAVSLQASQAQALQSYIKGSVNIQT